LVRPPLGFIGVGAPPRAIITNSSPPTRAIVSPARTAPESLPATCRSNWSPAKCPSRSLIPLKLSRSRQKSENFSP